MPERRTSDRGKSSDEAKVPTLDSRYGTRPIRFIDTGEPAALATIDGKPVGLEPSEAALAHFAHERRLELVTSEFVRYGMANDRLWRDFRASGLLTRLRIALRGDR